MHLPPLLQIEIPNELISQFPLLVLFGSVGYWFLNRYDKKIKEKDDVILQLTQQVLTAIQEHTKAVDELKDTLQQKKKI